MAAVALCKLLILSEESKPLWESFLRFPSRLCETCVEFVLEFPHVLHQRASNASDCTIEFSFYVSVPTASFNCLWLRFERARGGTPALNSIGVR